MNLQKLEKLNRELDQAIAWQRQTQARQERQKQIEAALMAQNAALAEQTNTLLQRCLEILGRKP